MRGGTPHLLGNKRSRRSTLPFGSEGISIKTPLWIRFLLAIAEIVLSDVQPVLYSVRASYVIDMPTLFALCVRLACVGPRP